MRLKSSNTRGMRPNRAIPLAGLALAGLLAFQAVVSAQPTFKKAPEFPTVKDLGGKSFSRQSLKGAYTLIVFFSIYGEDAGDLMDFAESVASDSVVNVMSVNIDPAADDVRNFVRESAISHPVILDLTLKMTGAFKIRKVPTVFLIGPDFGVVYAAESFGKDERQSLLNEIRKLPSQGVEAGGGNGISKKFNKKFLLSPDAKMAEFLPGDRQLALYLSGDSTLWVYDAETDERRAVASKVESAAWDSAGKRVVFSQIDKPGLWWKELRADKAIRITPFGNKPDWSPDGAFIVFHVHDNEIWVYNVEKKAKWRVPANGDAVSWSGDGKLLLIRGGGKTYLISPWAKMSLLKALGN